MEVVEVGNLNKYPLLENEMLDRCITKKDIAKKLGITERAVSNKIKGDAPFKWAEACTIQDEFFSHVDLRLLFMTKDDHVSA